VVSVVYRSARRGLQYAQRSSVLYRAAVGVHGRLSSCAAVFCCGRLGIRGGLPFGPARYTWWSSVLPGTVYVTFFCSAHHGIRGGLSFCPARPSVCAAVFLPVRRGCRCARPTSFMRGGLLFLPGAAIGMRGGLPFLPGTAVGLCGGLLPGAACAAVSRLARRSCRCARQTSFMRSGLRFCPERSTWRSSVLPSTAIGVRDRLPSCRAWCCGFVIGGPRSLVRLSDNPVVIGASDPRSRHSSRHSDMCEGRSRYVDNILRGEESPD